MEKYGCLQKRDGHRDTFSKSFMFGCRPKLWIQRSTLFPACVDRLSTGVISFSASSINRLVVVARPRDVPGCDYLPNSIYMCGPMTDQLVRVHRQSLQRLLVQLFGLFENKNRISLLSNLQSYSAGRLLPVRACFLSSIDNLIRQSTCTRTMLQTRLQMAKLQYVPVLSRPQKRRSCRYSVLRSVEGNLSTRKSHFWSKRSEVLVCPSLRGSSKKARERFARHCLAVF